VIDRIDVERDENGNIVSCTVVDYKTVDNFSDIEKIKGAYELAA
jgi:ATP-dependent helicase/DNAse subunit B